MSGACTDLQDGRVARAGLTILIFFLKIMIKNKIIVKKNESFHGAQALCQDKECVLLLECVLFDTLTECVLLSECVP